MHIAQTLMLELRIISAKTPPKTKKPHPRMDLLTTVGLDNPVWSNTWRQAPNRYLQLKISYVKTRSRQLLFQILLQLQKLSAKQFHNWNKKIHQGMGFSTTVRFSPTLLSELHKSPVEIRILHKKMKKKRLSHQI